MTNEDDEKYDQTCNTKQIWFWELVIFVVLLQFLSIFVINYVQPVWRWAWKLLLFCFFFNCCFHYQFLPPFFLPLLLCLALSHNFCREMRTTNQPVKWWLPHPEEPAALPGNYMNDNFKILKATWKAVYIPGMACLFPIKSISASLYLAPTEVCHLYSKHKPKPHKCHLLSFRSKNADNLRRSKGFCH